MRACPACGGEVTSRDKRQVYCSKACSTSVSVVRARQALSANAAARREVAERFECEWCGGAYDIVTAAKTRSRLRRHCSPRCAGLARMVALGATPRVLASSIFVKDCGWCGRVFTARQSNYVTCSAGCKAAWERARYRRRSEAEGRVPVSCKQGRYSRQRRERAAFVERVEHETLGKRDSWVCHLCSDPIDPLLRWPDMASRSIDHIVPLVHGGEHSYANTAIAHLGCNIAKGARCPG